MHPRHESVISAFVIEYLVPFVDPIRPSWAVDGIIHDAFAGGETALELPAPIICLIAVLGVGFNHDLVIRAGEVEHSPEVGVRVRVDIRVSDG